MLHVNVYRRDFLRLAALLGSVAELTVQRAGRAVRWLHAIGAAGILNGSWVLPRTTAHLQFFEKLQETVRKQGGHCRVTVKIIYTTTREATLYRPQRGNAVTRC